MSKKVIVLGATGAMGRYLIPKLVERGFLVDAVTIDDVTNDTAYTQRVRGFQQESEKYSQESVAE